eukprot:799307_1
MKEFDFDDMVEFRELIIDEIKSADSGLTMNHPLVSTFDGVIPGDEPLIPSLVRLIFHDCSGFRKNSLNKYICDGCIKLDDAEHFGLYEGAINPIEYICDFYSGQLSRADCWALAATVAIELAANNTLSNPARTLFNLNPSHVDILPGDIPYFIGRA